MTSCFYGGERGGGKSDFQLGYQEDGALSYSGKSRGIMFRKTYPELEELQARAAEVFPGSGAIYKTQPSGDYPFSNCWYWPNGATVKMRFIEHERDYGRYHGHQYCVGVGTPVLMADGSWKPIDAIRVGDSVQTLEGPKTVLATLEPYLAPCVRLSTSRGSQIQPIWHPVLTSVGAVSGSRPGACQTDELLPQQNAPWQSAESLLYGNRSDLANDASSINDRNDCAVSEDVRRAFEQRPLLTFPVVLHSQLLRSSQSQSASEHHAQSKFSESSTEKHPSNRTFLRLDLRRIAERGLSILDRVKNALSGALGARAAYAPLVSAGVPSSPSGCPSGLHCDDGPPLHEAKSFQDASPSRGDAASQGHVETHSDGKGCIRGYSRQALGTYTHPYTKEQRRREEAVVSDWASLSWYGESWVCDLTIEDANHYITNCGVINKNTHISFDEVTEYPTPAGLLKMLSTLRSPHGVPCTMRATGNPGGIGHAWVKARYIDVAPPMHPFKDPDTGFTRMFVPSKTADNQILLMADPEYRNRIKAATGGNEALRKAWLEGDWNIIAGAFFDNWRAERHVIKPFTIPEHWTRFRSGDWGSARPFSFGWWAVVSDDHQVGHLTLPRGCLVRYREWYGMKRDEYGQPVFNTGLKLTAAQVGHGIGEREARDAVKPGVSVLDPAAFSQDGGPSIAERIMGAYPGAVFRRADNARVAQKGSIGGWDQLRDRLDGEGPNRPMLVTFDTCIDSIRTIPMQQHDADRLEDIDTAGEDHAADEWRYACMSRPWAKPSPIDPKPKFDRDMSINELISRQRERRLAAE